MLQYLCAIFRCFWENSIGVPEGFLMGKRDGETTTVTEVRVGRG
jgi:hypothetical protein